MSRFDTTPKATGERQSRYQRNSRRLPRLGESARTSLAEINKLRSFSSVASGEGTDQGLCDVCGDPAATRYNDELRCRSCAF